jgi:hypothetical protein
LARFVRYLGAGPPFSTIYFSFPITKRGCPILAFFARVGRDAADSINPSCFAAYIATMAPTTCTLSRVLASASCLFSFPHGTKGWASPPAIKMLDTSLEK